MSNLAPKYFASAFTSISEYISDPAKKKYRIEGGNELMIKEEKN